MRPAPLVGCSLFIAMSKKAVLQRGMARRRALRPSWRSAAFVQDRHAIAHGGDLGQQVGGEDHRRAGGRLLADQLAQRGHLHRVERVGRFIQHQQCGLVHQRAGQPQTLALALREHASQAPRQRLQFQALDDAVRASRSAAPRRPRRRPCAFRCSATVSSGHSGARSGSQPIQARASSGCSRKSWPFSLIVAAVRPQRAGDHRQAWSTCRRR